MPSIEQDEPTVSVFQSNLSIDEKLDRARTKLLDLSARNRLLNMPRAAKGAKAVEVVDVVNLGRCGGSNLILPERSR